MIDDYQEIMVAVPHLLREFDGDKLALLDVKLYTKSKKIIHIEIPLKVTLELQKRIILYEELTMVAERNPVVSKDVVKFDILPFTATHSILGDGSQVKVYEFRLDKLELGKPTLGFNHSIMLENITVRLINRKDFDFIVSWNVLKYLSPTYNPSPTNLVY